MRFDNGLKTPHKSARGLVSVLVLAALIMSPLPALAYIGPGAGLGTIAILIALVLGVGLLLVGLVWFPLKRMLKGKSGGAAKSSRVDSAE